MRNEAFNFLCIEPIAAAIREIEDLLSREDIVLNFTVNVVLWELGNRFTHVEGNHLSCLHSFDYQVSHVLEHHL